MSTTTQPTPAIDPSRLLEQLDSRTIIGRLAALDREQRDLRALLAAVRRRERRERDGTAPAGAGGPTHAA
jgi:hypothetical protein